MIDFANITGTYSCRDKRFIEHAGTPAQFNLKQEDFNFDNQTWDYYLFH
jgi:hypothetical protein